MQCKILAFSDIHLGDPDCQPKKVINVLRKVKAEKIIIVGDLFDSKHLSRLKKNHWRVLSTIRSVSKKCEVIYLLGNHCFLNMEHMTHLLGIKTGLEHEETINGKKFIFLHGDIFDFFVSTKRWRTDLTTDFYYWLRTNFPDLARWVRHACHKLVCKATYYKDNAKKYCTLNKKDYIICGHSHFPAIEGCYVNTGSFCERKLCSYITINENAEIRLNYI
jgi:UDP-2,3-diacylglucosamine pyrophosphatase LpxH